MLAQLRGLGNSLGLTPSSAHKVVGGCFICCLVALGVDLFVTFGFLSIGPGIPRPRTSDPDKGGKGPDSGRGQ